MSFSTERAVPANSRSVAAEIAREANGHILALEARIRGMGLRARPDQMLIGLFCECGCMGIAPTTRDDYEREAGVWLQGHRPR
jgi:hypothetical protein